MPYLSMPLTPPTCSSTRAVFFRYIWLNCVVNSPNLSFHNPLLLWPEFCHQTTTTGERKTLSGSPFFVTNNIEYRDGFREENTSKKTRSRSRRQKIGGGEERGLRTKWRGKSRPPTANKASQNGMALRVRSKVAYRSSILLFFPFGRVIVSAFQFRNGTRSPRKKFTR